MAGATICPSGLGNSTADGKCEESIDFKRMIHKIHAADIVVYGFGGSVNDFAGVTYPGRLNQCESCHAANTYYPVDATKVRATTTSTGADRRIPTDDTALSPNAAVCTGCHSSTAAWAHMEQNGALEGAKQADGTVLNSAETCQVCHAAGRSADVKVMHEVGIYTFDD